MNDGWLYFLIRHALFSSLTRSLCICFAACKKNFTQILICITFFTTFSVLLRNRTKVLHFKSEVELKMKTHERYGMVVVLRIEHYELESLFLNSIISREKILFYIHQCCQNGHISRAFRRIQYIDDVQITKYLSHPKY